MSIQGLIQVEGPSFFPIKKLKDSQNVLGPAHIMVSYIKGYRLYSVLLGFVVTALKVNLE
ncbi:MAG: hypothetical protein NVS1B13_03380 [Flavisolibacter sp.]